MRRRASADAAQPHGELLVIDGTNVCFWYGQAGDGRHTYHSRVSMRPLLVLLAEILDHGDDFYCIFDATTVRHICERGNRKEARIVDNLLRTFPRHFYRVTGNSSADGAIVHFADRHNCRIVTNDKHYGDRFGSQCPWLLRQDSPRLITGNYQRNGLMTLERLSYCFMEVPDTFTGDLLDRLVRLLSLTGRGSAHAATAVPVDIAPTPVVARTVEPTDVPVTVAALAKSVRTLASKVVRRLGAKLQKPQNRPGWAKRATRPTPRLASRTVTLARASKTTPQIRSARSNHR